MKKLIFDRKNGEYYEEKQFMEKELCFLYETPIGRFLLNSVISRRWFSKLYTSKYYMKNSVGKIQAFISRHNIDMTEYPARGYKSFDDFFTRSILPEKRPFPFDSQLLSAPADAKLTALYIKKGFVLKAKGFNYSLDCLLRNKRLASLYNGGICLLFRLTVDDCHRYSYIDNGKIIGQKEISGKLHTVGPFSNGKCRVLTENHRALTVMKTTNLGVVTYVEVGALLVGCIHNHPAGCFERGQEKGYFSYGGSTILLLLQEGAAEIDKDILEHSEKGIEVKVRMGERIGKGYGFSLRKRYIPGKRGQ